MSDSIKVLNCRAQRLLKEFGLHGVRYMGPKRLATWPNVGGKTVSFLGELIGGWGEPLASWEWTPDELAEQAEQRRLWREARDRRPVYRAPTFDPEFAAAEAKRLHDLPEL